MTIRVENSNAMGYLTRIDTQSSKTNTNDTISFKTQQADETPKPQRDPNDKRPNIEDRLDNAWEWINGNFNTEDVLSVNNQGYFVELTVMQADTEEGIITGKYKITKSGNSTTITENNGDGTKFTYVVNNKSGKLEYLIYGNGETIHYKADGSKELFEKQNPLPTKN